MGTQRPVEIGEAPEDLGGPVAEHHGKKKEKEHKKDDVAAKIKAEKFKKEEEKEEPDNSAKRGSAASGQDNLDNQDNQDKEEKREAMPAGGQEKKEKSEIETSQEKPKKAKVGKTKIRSKKYQEIAKLIDRQNIYPIEEAIALTKKTNLSKFDGKVEVHARNLNKTGKPENVRGTLSYPHATGKSIKVVIMDEKKIEQIQKTQKIDFDVALATPALMPQVGKLARILGPKGKMPNPKSGTVTEKPEARKKELEEGLVEYKSDSGGNIHQIIGKVSDEPKKLEENLRALLAVLPKEKIVSLHLSATMGPSIKTAIK